MEQRSLPPVGQSPISAQDFGKLTEEQKHQLAAAAHHATVKGSAKSIFDAVNVGMEAGMKMNEMIIILLFMHEAEYATKVIPNLIGEENLIERCNAQKIKVAIFVRPMAEFSQKLRGINGPGGEWGIYDGAADAMALPLEEDRLMVVVFEMNRCSTIVLRYDPARAEEILKKAAEKETSDG